MKKELDTVKAHATAQQGRMDAVHVELENARGAQVCHACNLIRRFN